MNVLMVGSNKKVSGGITTVINQYRNWENTNINFVFLSTYRFKNLFLQIMYFIQSFIKCLIIFIFKKIDIVHIHMSYGGSFYRKKLIVSLSKAFRKKIILHMHGSQFEKFYNSSKNKKAIVNLLEKVDCVLALGFDWKKFYDKIAPNANVIVLQNAVMANEFRIPPKDFTISYSGVLNNRKAPIDLLKAILKLQQDDINVKTIFMGDGPNKNEMIKFIKNNGMNNIVLTGEIPHEEVDSLLSNTTIFVLPSYNEGLPMSILEAMSFGIPIISTSVGSITEAVKDGLNGFVIKPGDIDSIYKRIKELYNDADKVLGMSKKSYDIFKEKFDISNFYKKNLTIYNSILNNNED